MSSEAQRSRGPGEPLSVPQTSRRPFTRREGWLAAIFFALVVVVAFPQVVFLGRSLVATEHMNPLDYRFTAANYGPNFVPLEEWNKRGIVPYANFHDPGSAWWQSEPALHFFRKAIFSGQLPFWDPSAAGGAPAYANLTQSFFFPPQIVLSLAGATSGQKNIYILLIFWASGYGMYCLLRMHGVMPLASAAAGLIFLFSGAIQQIAPITFMAQVAVCLPLLLIVTKWFFNEPSWRRTSILAASYAVVSLASFPPLLMAGFAFTVFYFLCVLVIEKRDSWRPLILRYMIAVLLSLGLVAAYYLPTLFVAASATHATAWYRIAGLEELPLHGIYDLLSPTAHGGGGIAAVYSAGILAPTQGHLFYVGVPALLLAGLALGGGGPSVRALLVACLGGSGLILLKIFGVPPVQWIGLLPIFCNIHYTQYFGVQLAFIIALFAGIGLDRVLQGGTGYYRSAFAVVMVAVLLRSLWVYARETGALLSSGAWRWIADYRMLVVFAAIAVVALFVLTMGRNNRWNRAGGLALIALICVEGIVNATYPRQRRWDVFAHPPRYVSVLQQMQPRSRGFIVSALNANLGSAFDIEALDSLYTFVSTRIHRLYQRYASPGPSLFLREAGALPPDAVLDRAGIGWLLVRREIHSFIVTAAKRSYPIAYEDDYVQIFRRDTAPRHFFSSEYRVTDASTALDVLSTAPDKEIVLESVPPFAATPNRADDPDPEVIWAKLNSLGLQIRAPRPGLLYIADAYDRGWTATVNGQPATIVIANYAFRAIAIPAGDIRVTLRYLPVGLIPGTIISLVSLGVAILLARRPFTANDRKRASATHGKLN